MTAHDRQERTDHLETTIHSIELLQQTGVLSIQRAKGGVRETANLIFLQGQVVDAIAGSRIGQDALDWVITWGSCRYTFEIRFPSEIVVPAPSLPIMNETRTTTSPLTFISQVVQKYTHTFDSAQTTEEKSHEEAHSTHLFPGTSLPVPHPFNPPTPHPFNPSTPFPPSTGQQVEMIRPRAPFRLINGSEAVSYMGRFGLSRMHRHVFFLLDGHRTAIDVARLTGRSFYEIQHLLIDLERLGLIRMEHTSIGEVMNDR